MARRARSAVTPSEPLGSLTQASPRARGTCAVCSSTHVTRLGMSLTDGTAVQFVSCHRCEHRSWSSADGTGLVLDSVLESTRKRA